MQNEEIKKFLDGTKKISDLNENEQKELQQIINEQFVQKTKEFDKQLVKVERM